MRAFLGIPLPDAVDNVLDHALKPLKMQLRRKVRWSMRDHWHVTLRFFPHLTQENSMLLIEAVKKLAEQLNPFLLSLTSLGAFPHIKGRIIAAYLEKNEILLNLANQLENIACSLGEEPEQRPFFPHVTLARFHQKPTIIDSIALKQLEFQVDHFILYESRPTPEGSDYRQLEVFRLAHL